MARSGLLRRLSTSVCCAFSRNMLLGRARTISDLSSQGAKANKVRQLLDEGSGRIARSKEVDLGTPPTTSSAHVNSHVWAELIVITDFTVNASPSAVATRILRHGRLSRMFNYRPACTRRTLSRRQTIPSSRRHDWLK